MITLCIRRRLPASIDILDHDRIEVIEAHLPIPICIRLLQHQFQGLLVEVFLDLVVHLPKIIERQVVLVVPVVFLENSRDLLLGLVTVGLGVHRLHELDETDTSGLLHIELRHHFVSGLSVGIEAVLSEQQFEVIGKEDTHACRIIGVENFLEIDDVLVG